MSVFAATSRVQVQRVLNVLLVGGQLSRQRKESGELTAPSQVSGRLASWPPQRPGYSANRDLLPRTSPVARARKLARTKVSLAYVGVISS